MESGCVGSFRTISQIRVLAAQNLDDGVNGRWLGVADLRSTQGLPASQIGFTLKGPSFCGTNPVSENLRPSGYHSAEQRS